MTVPANYGTEYRHAEYQCCASAGIELCPPLKVATSGSVFIMFT